MTNSFSSPVARLEVGKHTVWLVSNIDGLFRQDYLYYNNFNYIMNIVLVHKFLKKKSYFVYRVHIFINKLYTKKKVHHIKVKPKNQKFD